MAAEDCRSLSFSDSLFMLILDFWQVGHRRFVYHVRRSLIKVVLWTRRKMLTLIVVYCIFVSYLFIVVYLSILIPICAANLRQLLYEILTYSCQKFCSLSLRDKKRT